MTDTKTAAPAVTLKVVADLTGPYGDHLAFDRDGKRWALADGRAIQLGSDGTLDRKLTAGEPIHHLAWSSDGKRLLASPQIYDLVGDAWEKLPGLGKAMTSGLDAPPPPEQIGIGAAAYAPDGRDLVLAAYFQPSRELGGSDGYSGPQERLLLVGPDRALRGALYAGDGEMRAIAVGDRLIAAGGATVQVWDRQSMRKVADLKHKLVARALAFNAEGDRLGVITADGSVSLWDLTAGKLLISFPAHQGDGYAIALPPQAADRRHRRARREAAAVVARRRLAPHRDARRLGPRGGVRSRRCAPGRGHPRPAAAPDHLRTLDAVAVESHTTCRATRPPVGCPSSIARGGAR